MSDLVRVARRIYIGAGLDSDGEVEMEVDPEGWTWLNRSEILALITHLNEVLNDADKKQETER